MESLFQANQVKAWMHVRYLLGQTNIFYLKPDSKAHGTRFIKVLQECTLTTESETLLGFKQSYV